MMKAPGLVALLAAGLLAGCGRGSTRLETRTFSLHYLTPENAVEMLRPYVDEHQPGATMAMRPGSSFLTVRGTADNLERIARVLAEYDRPQPGVRLTFKVIRADGAARADPSIADVEAALRSLFRFAGYALVAEGVMTGSEHARSEQTLDGAGGPYGLTAMIESVNGTDSAATVRLVVRLTTRTGGTFETTVGVPVGRTAVLGNVTGGTPNSAMILTVRPDLVAN
jgi:hypothetical protein